MQKNTQAIKIDVASKSLSIVTLNDWQEIAPSISENCSLFECPVTFENGDTIYVDEEGLFNHFEGGFIMDGWKYPLVGNALLIGTDYEGDSKNVETTMYELLKMITWVSKEDSLEWKENASDFGSVIFF
jgi:hypothetical protein